MELENPGKCPVCCRNAAGPIAPAEDFYRVSCDYCGEYRITPELAEDLPSEIGDSRPYLTAATRQASEESAPLDLTRRNWRGYADAHRHTSITRKLDKLLRYIQRRSEFPGATVPIDTQTFPPIIDARDQSEVRYFAEHASKMNYIEGPITSRLGPFRISIRGWEYLDPGGAGAGIPGRVFVAMSFDDDLEEVYVDGIEPALEVDCGLDPQRVDLIHHNEKVCDRILAEIRRCQFVVADYTRHKHGVYFEDGFAQGLGRQVVRTCRHSDIENAHFDTRQYNHIVWRSLAELRTKLADRLKGLGLAART